MKAKHRILILVLMCLCLTALCSAASAMSTTVMMYMCGTDLQEDCLTDIKEMTAAKYGDDVKVVVLAGGAKKWSDSELKRGKLNLLTVANGKRSYIEDWGSGSMGSTDTLKRFVTYCWNNYHSDRNMLIMWDHGSSAVAGMCFDEVHSDDSLQLTELESVFKQLSTSLSGFHLNIIGADACLMASYEMAATLAPYADYYVGSEELEPGLGWYYTQWLTGLGKNPNMSDRELAVSIVAAYKYACEKDNPKDYLTLSVIDLSAMSELTAQINSLASTLTNHLSGNDLGTISRTLQSCYVFGSFDSAGSDMIDLTDFISLGGKYDTATATAAATALKNAVVYSYANNYVPAAEGMSIFIPMENGSELSSYIKSYSTSALSGYVGFVKAFAKATSGNSWNFGSSSSSPSSVTDDDEDFWDSLWGYSGSSGSCEYDDDNDCWSGWDSWGYDYGSGYGCDYGDDDEDDWFDSWLDSWFGDDDDDESCDYGEDEDEEDWLDAFLDIVFGEDEDEDEDDVDGSGFFGGSSTAKPTPRPTATPRPTVTPKPVVTTAPTSAPAAATPENYTLADKAAFSITLTDEDMRYLSHADLLLYQDYSDENGYDLDELGRVRNTWTDWDNNTVYAVFDNNWTYINDVVVVMYEQTRTDYARRCLVPVVLNGKTRTYLVVEYLSGAKDGTILGTSVGWSENNLPVRGVTPLKNGDTFTPIYPSFSNNDASAVFDLNSMERSTTTYDDDPDFVITWDGTQKIEEKPLQDMVYCLAFRLYDIFGGETNTPMIHFTIGDGIPDEYEESEESGEALELGESGLKITLPADFTEGTPDDEASAYYTSSDLDCYIYIEDADSWTLSELVDSYLSEVTAIDSSRSYTVGGAKFGYVIYESSDSSDPYLCAEYFTVQGDELITLCFVMNDDSALPQVNEILSTISK